jgi:5-formyltetrahydrofolate cyclo-ligase
MDPARTKRRIRDAMRRQRKLLSPVEQHQAALAVAERLFSLDALKRPATVFSYLAARHELPTRPIIERLFAAGHTVAVPYSEPDGLMIPKILTSFSDVTEGRFGIPTSHGPALDYSPTLTLVPALAFDAAGNRVGYGDGYYDRFLATHPETISVGLAYDFQLIEDLPAEGYDVVLSYVITPSQILKIPR